MIAGSRSRGGASSLVSHRPGRELLPSFQPTIGYWGTDVAVGVISAVNAAGDIDHPDSNQILASARREDGQGSRDTMAATMDGHRVVTSPGSNTRIEAVAINVSFSKTEINKMARMAHDGFARSINPVHTMSDGDTIFALSSGKA
nr:P1 family peptidase [Microvirga zambiensis]